MGFVMKSLALTSHRRRGRLGTGLSTKISTARVPRNFMGEASEASGNAGSKLHVPVKSSGFTDVLEMLVRPSHLTL